MTLTQLEYVLAVNKHRHFGRAAAACHVTQPTLSMQLQKLEEELQVIIFDRSKNPILPTMEGHAIIEQARNIIREQAKLLNIIKESKGDLIGDFKLAIIPTLAPYLLPLFIKEFVDKYPKVNLIIEEYKTEDIIRLLEDDEIDAALLVTPLHNNKIIERVLFYEPFYLFINPAHPFMKKSKIKEEELSLAEIWLLNKGNCFRDQVLKICSEKNIREQRGDNIRFESGNMETLKNMVLKTNGYTLLPHLAMLQLSSSKQKLVKEFVRPVPTREVSLVYARSFQKERIIDALEKEILAHIPSGLKSLKNKDLEIVEIF